MGIEGTPKFENIDLPPLPPNTETSPEEWKEYNRKREEWERRQGNKGGKEQED